MPIQIMVTPSFEGSLEEGLTLLSEGDSAVFKVSNDSMYAMATDSLPKGIEAGSFTNFHVKVVKIYSKADMEKEQETQRKEEEEQQKKAFAQLEKDTLAIKTLLQEKGIKAKRTENGVYYVIKKQGTGEKISRGDSVTVNYTGRLTDGKEFDSSIGKKPFTFRPGTGGVIYGWEELALKLQEGDKVTAYIPSILGYGPYGAGENIPPDANLVFDIEILDVKKFQGF